MKNTIIDFIRIPVDENGGLLYALDEVYDMFQAYHKLYPDHEAFMMPADISIWEDLDLTSLKSIRDYLNEVIEKKEKDKI